MDDVLLKQIFVKRMLCCRIIKGASWDVKGASITPSTMTKNFDRMVFHMAGDKRTHYFCEKHIRDVNKFNCLPWELVVGDSGGW